VVYEIQNLKYKTFEGEEADIGASGEETTAANGFITTKRF
jgi:hypothetical protein